MLIFKKVLFFRARLLIIFGRPVRAQRGCERIHLVPFLRRFKRLLRALGEQKELDCRAVVAVRLIIITTIVIGVPVGLLMYTTALFVSLRDGNI